MTSHVDLAHHASEEAWRAISVSRSHPVTELHVSQLDKCLRKIHYQASNAPVTDPDAAIEGLKIDAHLGTAIHALYLPYLAGVWPHVDPAVANCSTEYLVRLERGPVEIVGSADIVAWGADGTTAWVWDAKTCEYSRWDAVAAGHIPAEHVDQVARYARIIELTTDRRIPSLFLYYVCRSDPLARKDFRRSRRYFTVEIDFDETLRRRCDDLFDAVARAATSPTAAPRWFAEASRRDANRRWSPCRSCPWQSDCLGKPVVCEDGDAQVRPEVAAELARARAEVATDKADAIAVVKDFIRAHRDKTDKTKVDGTLKELVADLGLEPGTYLDEHGVKFELYPAGGGMIADQKAMKELLTAAGHDIPTKPRAQSLEVRIVAP